ncbi:unnamed protein product [Owenia fusiformis]|uniref:Uncharacterized protein n=1 Tax=Owenia fusiformis TaxID=6347 RepID=A0A8S4Q9Y3_OWEFU|nr:unnamed protein product [Owenia fusiformis]
MGINLPPASNSESGISQLKIHLSTYDGTTSFENFIIQFDIIATYLQWDNYTKAVYLVSCLHDKALSVLSAMDSTERMDYDAVVRNLILYCDDQHTCDYCLKQLYDRVRLHGETLTDLAHDLDLAVTRKMLWLSDTFLVPSLMRR